MRKTSTWILAQSKQRRNVLWLFFCFFIHEEKIITVLYSCNYCKIQQYFFFHSVLWREKCGNNWTDYWLFSDHANSRHLSSISLCTLCSCRCGEKAFKGLVDRAWPGLLNGTASWTLKQPCIFFLEVEKFKLLACDKLDNCPLLVQGRSEAFWKWDRIIYREDDAAFWFCDWKR